MAVAWVVSLLLFSIFVLNIGMVRIRILIKSCTMNFKLWNWRKYEACDRRSGTGKA